MPADPALLELVESQTAGREDIHQYTTVNHNGQVQPEQPDHVCLQVPEAEQRGLHQTGPVSARLPGLQLLRASKLWEK